MSLSGIESALVGRDADLALLRQKMAAAAAGRGSIVLVAGERGSGKSRLGAEVERLADKCGMLHLAGKGDPAGSETYGCLVDILKDLLLQGSETDRQTLRDACGELAPQLCEQLFPGSPEATFTHGDSDAEMRQALFLVRVKSLLLSAAEDRPLVLFIDDLHLADWPSLLLLRHLALRIRQSRLVLIGTFCPSADERDGRRRQLDALLLSLCSEPCVDLLRLGRLSLTETRMFAESCFAPSEFSEDLIEQLHEKTAGLPLMLIESLEFLRDRRVIHRQGDIWRDHRIEDLPGPDTVRELARNRLRRLPAEYQTILGWGSAQGHCFEGRLLAQAMGRPPVEILRILGRIEHTTRLIMGTAGGFRFAHGVLAESCYELLTPTERRRVHQRIADILERTKPRKPEPLAFHFYRSHSQIRALPYLIASGQRSRSACAYLDAKRYLEAALGTCQLLNPQKAQSKKVDVLLLLAEIDERLGDWSSSARRCRKVLQISRPERHGLAVGKALVQLASLRLRRGDPKEAIQLNKEALDILEPLGDQSVVADVHLKLGLSAIALSRFDEARRHFTEARHRAGASGDDRLVGLIRQQLGVLATLHGEHLDATVHLMQAVSAQHRSADRYALCQSYLDLGASREAQREWIEALRCWSESAQLARQIGAPDLLAVSLVRQARALVMSEESGAAQTACQTARSCMEAIGCTNGLTQCDLVEAMICRHHGQYARAEELLERARHSLWRQGDRLALAACNRELGLLLQRRGDVDRASRRLEESSELFRELGSFEQAGETEALLPAMTQQTE